MSNYLISISKTATLKDGTIHDPNSELKVNVFDLLKSKFTPSKGEVQYFVTTGKETLAFETKGFKKHRQLLVLQMISRYCIIWGCLRRRFMPRGHCDQFAMGSKQFADTVKRQTAN